mmetsp:Transcript_24508/g.68218  ORF Transcript_24508/g.68218 Transcript_24508/m.68218 type:complete len:129 (-) Transcript_24508:972-1358(-)
MAPAVLLVSTSADNWGEGNATGTWLEEVACPYYLFKEAGFEVDVASITGGKVPIDPSSLSDNYLTDHTRKMQVWTRASHTYPGLTYSQIPSSCALCFRRTLIEWAPPALLTGRGPGCAGQHSEAGVLG